MVPTLKIPPPPLWKGGQEGISLLLRHRATTCLREAEPARAGNAAAKEGNWIQTVPGKGWFSVLRLYSRTEAWYDKTGCPGEIELVK